jgi:hypothetical protein
MASVYNTFSKCVFFTYIFKPNCNFICHFGGIPPLNVIFSQTGVELFAASVVGKIFLYLKFCVFGGGEFPVAFN